MSKANFDEVRETALDAVRKLQSGEMDVKTALAIKGLLDTIIDTGKTQVEYLKAIPNSIKEQMRMTDIICLAAPLDSPDIRMDQTMDEIRAKQREPYQFTPATR